MRCWINMESSTRVHLNGRQRRHLLLLLHLLHPLLLLSPVLFGRLTGAGALLVARRLPVGSIRADWHGGRHPAPAPLSQAFINIIFLLRRVTGLLLSSMPHISMRGGVEWGWGYLVGFSGVYLFFWGGGLFIFDEELWYTHEILDGKTTSGPTFGSASKWVPWVQVKTLLAAGA